MCGRYVITSPPDAIRALFGYGERPNFPPRYNVAPTQPIPTVRLADGKRTFALMRWGFIPAWVDDPKTLSLLINARRRIGARQAGVPQCHAAPALPSSGRWLL
jgi:putative SOS response-associated peptidase YedK